MNVLMLSPGFPEDMPYFTRGLAQAGARVVGVGDQHPDQLPPLARDALADYVHVGELWNESAVLAALRHRLGGQHIDRVETLWEPAMHLAARLREQLGAPGLDVERTRAFRDKVHMKHVLREHGVRVPHHARATTAADVRAAVERIGFPAIVKPVAGAGSADTLRVDDGAGLDAALAALRHVPEVAVEEYVDGEEFTFDTLSVGGRPVFENVAWYRPKPLVARHEAWISPQAIVFRDLERPDLQKGRALGRQVLEALGFDSGFTHMEWFLTPQGEAVFGEIGGRSPGGRLTHGMNHACAIDLFAGWGEVVQHGRFSQSTDRPFNAAMIFKRAQGEGRIQHHWGLRELLEAYGAHVAHLDLVPVGQPRRDWTQVVTGDGWIVVRHPDLDTTIEIADRFAADLRILAG
ncbi:MAG: ATP-grasp domain-containing protein [Planctomycetes bacterium]|nr:ATP-grasp domain-containing protein [Planctomycetota bacterium]